MRLHFRIISAGIRGEKKKKKSQCLPSSVLPPNHPYSDLAGAGAALLACQTSSEEARRSAPCDPMETTRCPAIYSHATDITYLLLLRHARRPPAEERHILDDLPADLLQARHFMIFPREGNISAFTISFRRVLPLSLCNPHIRGGQTTTRFVRSCLTRSLSLVRFNP